MVKLVFFAFSLFSIGLANVAADSIDILYVLDASGSMKEQLQGEPQFDVARRSLLSSLSEVSKGTKVGLRVYAHRAAQVNKAESCKDTEQLIPIRALSIPEFEVKLKMLNPKGFTPLAFSLEQAAHDFPLENKSEKVIILLSDGEETCGGDPVATVKKLYESGIKIKIHTVGFNVDDATRAQLKKIAEVGQGLYFDAKDAQQLSEALKQAAQKSSLVEKRKSHYGKEIKGGDSFETAVLLEKDTEYRLNHHQRKGYYDYFTVALEAGQEVHLKIKTLEKGLDIRENGKIFDTDNPYAGLSFNAPTRARIVDANIFGKKFGEEKASYPVAVTGTYFILIGSDYADMEKDNHSFSISIITKGDADGEKDAGEKLGDALPVTAKRYEVNYLGDKDLRDLFVFTAEEDEEYAVSVIPGEDFTNLLSVRIVDEFRKSVYTQEAEKEAEGFKTEFFSIPKAGKYYVEISGVFTRDKLQSYSFELYKQIVPKKIQPKKPQPVKVVSEEEDAEAPAEEPKEE